MRIHAFSGTRFAVDRDPGPLAGPPYDQIDDTLRAQLQQDPLHFAHLIRPAAGRDPHLAAADLYRSWLDSGIVAVDAETALYPYEIVFPDGRRRLGITTLLGLEPEDSPIIRPHEATVPRTVEERLSLLRATQVDFEPILVLVQDDGALDSLLTADLGNRQPLVSHRDAGGHLHNLYRIEDAERIDEIQRLLAPRVGLIADGHHRYTVARRYAEEVSAKSGSPAACKLAVVTSLSADGLTIDPIHRQLRAALPVEAAARLATSHRSITAASGEELAQAVAAATQPSLGVTVGGRTELWGFDASLAPAEMPKHLHHLAVGWLHSALFPAMGLTDQAATDGTVLYRSSPDVLLRELATGAARMGFWLPPMSGEDFSRAMEGGRLLPPKSTRFLPKVASGLVWAGHDCQLR